MNDPGTRKASAGRAGATRRQFLLGGAVAGVGAAAAIGLDAMLGRSDEPAAGGGAGGGADGAAGTTASSAGPVAALHGGNTVPFYGVHQAGIATVPQAHATFVALDLREGVDTMPILLLKKHAAQGTIDEDGRMILEMLEGDLSSDESLAVLVGALKEHEVLEETRQLARAWADRAVGFLDPLPGSDAKDALVAFAMLMVDRAS